LKKRTSINSKQTQPLHKEKEMADFRKCLLAFAVVALLSSFAVPASAQGITPALQCTFNAAVTPTVRAEGLTELVGDIVLNCTGGTPTAAGLPVPQANITVFLSTNLTSRITSNPFSEVLMLFDEPHSATNPTTPLSVCDPNNASLGICSLLGTGNGIGTYNPGNTTNLIGGTPAAPTNVTRANVFQARQTGVNQVTFFGVPIDPPGTQTTRIIRITNLRGNANQLGVSSTLVPTQIVANISVSPPNLLPLNNPQQTVAFVQRGLVSSVQSATTFIQCIPANPNIAANPASALQTGGQSGQQFSVRFEEGFPSSWKERNISVHLNNTRTGIGSAAYPGDQAQDVPGANYFSESGFLVNGVRPNTGTQANTAAPAGYGPFLDANPAFPTTRGLNLAGVANSGTRLMVQFASLPGGTQLFLPTRVNLVNPLLSAGTSGTDNVTGFAVLTSTDANGAGSFSAAAGNATGLAPVSITGGTGLAVYEILYTDPFNIERLNIPMAVAFAANVGNNLPAPGVQGTASGSFAPLSNVGTASDTAPIPRFAPSATPVNAFRIERCSCNMLFPFVSNQAGFDTGIAISNTSVDPFGTAPQTGFVTINYYSAGTPPPRQRTNASVAAGDTLAFTLSGGGNYGIAATPGFQGYIIAQAEFQYCHGFGYLSGAGEPYSGEGYLGIILDAPGLQRTGQVGENMAH
jgi:hypothetical protein